MSGSGGTTAMLFLTYRRLPSFEPGGYEAWVASEDNPFFNTIGGILEYQNWAVETVSAGNPGFDYFDLLYLDGPDALERMWFDPDLTRFRRGWVARWGYGPAPAEVNRFGWLLTAAQPHRPVAPTTLGVAIGSPGGGAEGEAWAVSERLPKHYARPEGGPPPDPWREGAGAAPALGGATVTLVPGGDPPAAAAIAFTARCFAAPVGDGR